MRGFVLAIQAALILAGAGPSVAQPPAAEVTVVGPTGQTLRLTAADVAAMPRGWVQITIHDQVHGFDGALLQAILARVGAPSGDQLRGAALTDVVIVTARDGYQVVLSLAEIDPAFHQGAYVILADRDNGAAISPEDGPFRLVVNGEAKPARSARMVTRIEVRQLH